MAEGQDIISKELECPICLETFSSPKSLPCMHTFCEKCICKHASDLIEEGAQVAKLSCPVCRSPIPAPAGNPNDWAAKLPNNSVVLSHSASNPTDNDVPVYCEACVTLGERHISVAFCVTCSEYLCQACYKSHKSFKMSRDHQITVQSVLRHQMSNSTKDAMYICHTHGDKLTYFCREHGEICCMQCVLKDHRKCKQLLSAEGLVKDVSDSQDFKQAQENLDVLRKMFVVLTDNRTKTLETIQQQKTDVIKSIKDWSNLIKERVDKLETVTIHELEQLCKERMIIISDQVVECKSAIAAIETSQTMLVESTKSDDRARIFVTLTKISQQLLKYLQKYDRIENRSNEIQIGFHRNKSLEEIIQTPVALGQVSCETSRIPKLSHDCSFEGDFMKPSRVLLNSTVTFNAEHHDDDNACNITSGVYLPDKRIVLYDEDNWKIKLFDKHFHFVSHLEFSHIDKPMLICIVDEGTVAASMCTLKNSKGGILLVSVTDSLKKVRKINIERISYGIASYKKNLMVCTGGDSLLIFDASYRGSKMIPSFDRRVYKGISLSPDGQRIHYTVKDKVVIMDVNGDKLETFESDELKGVVAVTVDKNGIIYCCGQQSSNVVLFSPEGRKLYVLLSREHGLKNPVGICLNDRNNKLLVFESNSSEVKIFTLV